MANEAATAWISPTFIQKFYSGPHVVVLNPTESATTVVVGFYRSTGGLEATVQKLIGPRKSKVFKLEEISNSPYFEGWVYVDSEDPVFPAGYTVGPVPLHSSDQEPAHYAMAFFRAEGIERPIYKDIGDLPPAKAEYRPD